MEFRFHNIGSSHSGHGIPGMNSPKRKPQFGQMLVKKSSKLLMFDEFEEDS